MTRQQYKMSSLVLGGILREKNNNNNNNKNRMSGGVAKCRLFSQATKQVSRFPCPFYRSLSDFRTFILFYYNRQQKWCSK